MENTNEKDNNLFEKKIIIDFIIITIILIFISLFFVYDIVDRGTINSSQTAVIEYPNDIVVEENTPDNNTSNNTENTTSNNSKIVDSKARLRIFQGTKEWNELKELDIFKNDALHVTDNKIAPDVQGTYTYTVENERDENMKYNMEYTDVNPYNINMVYKLKVNGKYVAGNDETWVKVNDLNQNSIKIKAKTTDVYTLDWKWEGSENDTEIGKTDGANYKIRIKSYAEIDTDDKELYSIGF